MVFIIISNSETQFFSKFFNNEKQNNNNNKKLNKLLLLEKNISFSVLFISYHLFLFPFIFIIFFPVSFLSTTLKPVNCHHRGLT